MANQLSSLQSKLMKLIAVIILALFLLIILMQAFWFYTRYHQVIQNNIDVAQAVGLTFQAFVRDVVNQENAIGNVYRIYEPDTSKKIKSYLESLEKPNTLVREFSIINSTGTVISSSQSRAIGLNVKDREYFHRLNAGNIIVVSDLLKTRTENLPAIIISKGFHTTSGKLDYAILAIIEVNKLGEILYGLKRAPVGYLTLFDRKGFIVYTDSPIEFNTDADRLMIKHDPLLRKALKGQSASGFFSVPIAKNPGRIGARVPIPDIGWAAGASVSVSNVLWPIVLAFVFTIIMTSILAGSTIFISRKMVMTLTHSLRVVENHVGRFAQGNYDLISIKSNLHEINSLIISTNSMALQLKEREERLRLLASVVQNSLDFIILLSPSMIPYYVNESGRSMVGLDISMDIDSLKGIDFIFSEDQNFFEHDVLPSLEKNGNWSGEIRFNHFKTKEPIYVLCNIFAIKNDDGQVIAWASVSTSLTKIKQANEELRKSEESFRQLANSMPQLVWTANPNGDVDYYNEKYKNFGGISPEKNEKWSWGPAVYEEDLQRTVDLWNHSIATGEIFQIELRIKHIDGTIHWYLSRAIPVRNKFGQITKWYGTATNIDTSKRIQLALAESEQHLRDLNQNLETIINQRTEQVRKLSTALTLAEQRERRRFSYVLHENLQQLLLGAKILLSQHFEDHKEVEPPVGEMDDITESLRLIDKAIDTTRSLSIELNPPVLRSQGLDTAIEWLSNHMYKTYKLNVDLTMKGAVNAIKNDTQLMLIQMIRELLANVIQHSGTLYATIDLICNNNRIQVIVTDKGRGFEPEEILTASNTDETRLSLLSIKERLKLFDGDLIINSKPGSGTRCEIILPFENC